MIVPWQRHREEPGSLREDRKKGGDAAACPPQPLTPSAQRFRKKAVHCLLRYGTDNPVHDLSTLE